MNIPESVKFIHLRAMDLTNNTILPNGGATLAYTTDTDRDGNPVTKVAAAFCHYKDNFNKKLGRIKAYGRLVQLSQQPSLADGYRFHMLPGDDPRRAADVVATELCEDLGLWRLSRNGRTDS